MPLTQADADRMMAQLDTDQTVNSLRNVLQEVQKLVPSEETHMQHALALLSTRSATEIVPENRRTSTKNYIATLAGLPPVTPSLTVSIPPSSTTGGPPSPGYDAPTSSGNSYVFRDVNGGRKRRHKTHKKSRKHRKTRKMSHRRK